MRSTRPSYLESITDGGHKLIEYACGVTQLFDLLNDPLERFDLSESLGALEIKADLRGQLIDYSESWDDLTHSTWKTFWKVRGDLRA